MSLAHWVAREGQWPPTSTVLAVVLPLASIAVSEALVANGLTVAGLWAYLLTLLALTVLPLRYPQEISIVQAFVLIPVFRLVNLGMPIFVDLTILWFPFIYAPFIPAVALLAHHNESVTIRTGWRFAFAGLPVFFLLSVLLAEIEYAIIRPEALVPTVSSVLPVSLLAGVMIGFVGVVEELIFRGLLQQTLQNTIGNWSGLLVASAVFGLMHAIYGVPAEVGFAFGFSLIVGLLYQYSNSIAAISLIHGIVNVYLFGFIPHQGTLLGFT